jgi:hypothetical protein
MKHEVNGSGQDKVKFNGRLRAKNLHWEFE